MGFLFISTPMKIVFFLDLLINWQLITSWEGWGGGGGSDVNAEAPPMAVTGEVLWRECKPAAQLACPVASAAHDGRE